MDVKLTQNCLGLGSLKGSLVGSLSCFIARVSIRVSWASLRVSFWVLLWVESLRVS